MNGKSLERLAVRPEPRSDALSVFLRQWEMLTRPGRRMANSGQDGRPALRMKRDVVGNEK
jgi:hypothetical protein